MIQSTHIPFQDAKVIEINTLVINNNNACIVWVKKVEDDSFSGIIVDKGTSGNYLGEYFDAFLISLYTPFYGSVTITHTK